MIKAGSTAFNLIMRYARKRLAAPNAEGIMEVMSNKQAMDFVKDLVNEFNRFGVPESAITVVDDVGKFANQIVDIKQQRLMQEFKKQMTPKKSADIIELQTGKKIDQSKGIMGGRQVDQTDDEATKALQDKLAKDKGYQKYRGETEEQIRERFKKQNKEAIERFKKNMDDLEDKATGGRVGLKAGMSKRAFLKLMGGAAAGIGALKTGALKMFGKGAAPVVEKTAEAASGAPSYFFDLVEKIKLFGKRSKVGPQERVNEFTYTGKDGSDYVMTEDIVTGDIKITKDKLGGANYGDMSYDTIEDRTEMVFRKGQMDETTKGKKPPDEYEEYKVEFDQDGTAADATDIDEISKSEIIKEVSDDAPSIKKAGGGIARMLGE